MDGFPKTCAKCKRTYADETAWSTLAYVGRSDDTMIVIELRNCPCANTLAIRVGTSPQLDRTLLETWTEAARAQIRAKVTRKGWNDVERLWRLAAEASGVAENYRDQQAYLQMADEAAAQHIIAQSATGK
jgi:hypothetical protein